MRRALALALLLMARAACADVAEPPGLWTGPMQGETPKSLAGARIVDADHVKALAAAGALLLDVSAEPPKPADAPKFWAPIHRSIPGAVWLPGAGRGDPDPVFAEKFARHIAVLSGANPGRAVVVFCHPACWGSWNAGKRLARNGDRPVFWFPGGIEAYEEKFDVAPVAPDRALQAAP